MSKLTDALREVRVYNDHGFFNDGGRRVYIGYSAAPGGRSPLGAAWHVYRFFAGAERVTDAGAAWYDHGHKAFPVRRHDNKAAKLAEAQAWAAEQYGVTEWARSPFGGYGDAEFVKARLADLKRQIASVTA